MKSAVHLDTHRVTDIEFQPASIDIWDAKYRLAAKDGNKIDASIDDTYQRVARALANVEVESKREEYFEEFLWALRSGAIPAGRIVSNAGAREHKPATSTINCTVSGTVGDSMDNILNKVHEAGLTLKAGCGIGYGFSTLRQRGASASLRYFRFNPETLALKRISRQGYAPRRAFLRRAAIETFTMVSALPSTARAQPW